MMRTWNMKRTLRALGWLVLLIMLMGIGFELAEQFGRTSMLGGSVAGAIWLCLILWLTRDKKQATVPPAIVPEASWQAQEDGPKEGEEAGQAEAEPMQKPRVKVKPLVMEVPSEEPEPVTKPKLKTKRSVAGVLTVIIGGIGLLFLFTALPPVEKAAPPQQAGIPDPSNSAPVESKQPTETLIATWGANQNSNLIHRDGKMVLQRKYRDGSVGSQELIERPTKSSGIRKFDIEEHRRSDYFTLSDSGDVNHFSWDGRVLFTDRATFIASNMMEVERNVQARSCTPRQLSVTATQFVQLHNELHAFKDDSEFALVGFALGSSYNEWLKRVDSLVASLQPIQLAFMEETGFYIGDLWELGQVYMTTADDDVISQEDSDYITGMERTIRVGIAIARCEA